MGEEFEGGVCGGTWWNPPRSLFSGGGAATLTSPCSVTQLGSGGFEMGSFEWPNEVIAKGSKLINVHNNNFDNSLDFPADLDSTLDLLGFGLSPTSSTTPDWTQLNIFCNGGDNEGNFGSMRLEDENLKINSSPAMANSGDSSSISSEAASYLIQTLFEDTDESQVHQPMNHQGYGCVMNSGDLISSSPCSWIKPSSPNISPPLQPPSLPLGQNNELHGGMNFLVNAGQATNLNSIRVSLLNSLKSRSKAPSFNHQQSQNSAYLAPKVNKEEAHNSKGKMPDQTLAKRPRIETPSPLPTFKVRKEKLGDRITALQQLVSPFGKTDTASVLHEAIEYIKFLHDQVNALSTPYLKNGAPMQHQQEKEEDEQDLKSRGLCLVSISSTYPVVQETPIDFWTPKFGGQMLR